MMRAAFLSVCFVLVGYSRGQNLVPNGSFEEYIQCPDTFGRWDLIQDWTSYYTVSADYFNTCAVGTQVAVPFSAFGYQEPASGDAYAGVITFSYNVPLYRELLATQLTEPLLIGVPVHLSFKASPGGFGFWPPNSARWVSKNVGMKFFVDLPTDWQSYLYPNSAALYLDAALSDTSTWVTVAGDYVPDSAYTYLVIANFFEDSLSAPVLAFPNGGAFESAYAFIDDVCVTYDDACGPLALQSGSMELAMQVENPVEDALRIQLAPSSHSMIQLRLVGLKGELVWYHQAPPGARSIIHPMNAVPPGIYLLHALDAEGHQRTLRLVHVPL